MTEPGPATWTLYDTGKFKDNYNWFGTWTLNGLNFKLMYQTGARAVWTGTVNPAATKMSGTMSAGSNMTGTWTATLISRVTTAPPPAPPGGSGVRPDGGQKSP